MFRLAASSVQPASVLFPMTADPWFSLWNYDLFRILFQYLPHGKITDEFCDQLISNPLLSSWVFGACFYRYWNKSDEQTEERRSCLLKAVLAFGLAGLVTLIVRPWIHWPAPVLNPDFQPLFPRYLWGNGSANCFPSHSTLAYFTIAAGFWPLHRRLSLWLSVLALSLVSLPRVYAGGHYPIDVLFSCCLGLSILVATWCWPVLTKLATWPLRIELPGWLIDLVVFLWIFELAEGFRAAESLVHKLYRCLW